MINLKEKIKFQEFNKIFKKKNINLYRLRIHFNLTFYNFEFSLLIYLIKKLNYHLNLNYMII